MRIILAWIVGVGLAGNGLLMLAAPKAWYGAIPGVPETGPFNPHFIRDIGSAYLVGGAALTWFTLDARARAAALAGGAFLALHALVHLWDGVAGREALDRLLQDLPSVFVPPALVLWLAWPRF